MNVGLGNLAELKGQLLAVSLRADTNYDAVIAGIGTGVAALMDKYCNRRLARAVDEQDVFSGDRRHWYLSRFPVEAVAWCEKQDTAMEGWTTLPGLIQAQQLEQGYVMFLAAQGAYWSRLRITYTGGFWFDTTEDGTGVKPDGAAALPADVKLAWYLQCQNVWKRWEKLGAGITERPEISGAVGLLELAVAARQLLTGTSVIKFPEVMDLLLTLQQDLADKLASEPDFHYHAVASWRRHVIGHEIEKRLPHLTARNGRKGCGILVRMPSLQGLQPNVTPPQGEIIVAIDVVEMPEINFNPGGTQATAEEVARAVRGTLHQFALEGAILLYQDEKAIEPLAGLEKEYPGCVGYRVLLRGRMSELPRPKCVAPGIAENGLSVTLATTDAGAAIYFTTDGTFPGPGNLGAQLYAEAFPVTSGTVLRWAAYLSGYLGSDAAQAQIL